MPKKLLLPPHLHCLANWAPSLQEVIWTLMILVMQIISRRLLEADLMLLQWSNQEPSLVKTPTPRARSKLKKFSPWSARSPRTRSSKSFEIMDFRHRSKLCKKKPECLEHHHTFEQRWVITGESGTNGNRWKYSILYSASWRCEKDHDASAGTTSCLQLIPHLLSWFCLNFPYQGDFVFHEDCLPCGRFMPYLPKKWDSEYLFNNLIVSLFWKDWSL